MEMCCFFGEYHWEQYEDPPTSTSILSLQVFEQVLRTKGFNAENSRLINNEIIIYCNLLLSILTQFLSKKQILVNTGQISISVFSNSMCF